MRIKFISEENSIQQFPCSCDKNTRKAPTYVSLIGTLCSDYSCAFLTNISSDLKICVE